MIIIGTRSEFLTVLQKAFFTYLTSGLPVVLILALIVLITFQTLIARPLNKLAFYTKTLDFSNLTSKKALKNKHRADEIGMVSNAITDMTNRLINDLKEKEISERKLADSNLRFQAVLDSLDVFVILIDLKTKKVLFSNKTASTILGDIDGSVYTDIIKTKYSGFCEWCNQESMDNLEETMEETSISEVENIETGQWFICRGRKIRWTTGEIVYLQIITDITSQKKYNNIMVQSEKMLSLGGLSAGMAHEINNPLAGMMQNAQAISNRLMSNSNANKEAAKAAGTDLESIRGFLEKRKIFNQLRQIQEAGIRAAGIVRSMLDFARKDSSRSSQNIAELMDKSVDLAGQDYDLKKKFDFRDIKIVRNYENNLPPIVCDSSKIQQVFFNILQNGAQAMKEQGGEKEPQFTLLLKRESGSIRIEITNTGSGINHEVQQRIFEPFFTTKSEGVGTGLGLSVSYFIITEIHNGEMQVESDGENWVKFIIHLPI